jgi:multidrug efflux system membrane fusion protein
MLNKFRQSWSRASGITRLIAVGIVVVLLAVLVYEWPTGSGGDSQQRAANRARFAGASGPVPVLAASAQKADVPVYLEAVGTTRALNTVTVQSQVDGKLLSINFKEGQDVNKGDVLARIDPTTYQAALDQAVAKKAQDEALLANAKLDQDRYERLAATNSINRQQADTQKSLVAQYEAQVKSDQGAIDNARAILKYTTIVAPIDGRTGIRMVDEGNVIRAASSTGIVVLTQLRPITVLFNLPQQNLPQLTAAFNKGPLTVEAQQSDSDAVIDRGTLQVVDNQVDQTTGTVKLKAEFPNANLQLWPGQFVNIRLTIDTLKQVTVIPTGAVQRGPNGTFVYIVSDDNKVSLKPIVVKMQDETQAVIDRGVQVGDRVVTTGFAQLSDNKEVKVSNANDAPATTTSRPDGSRRERRQRSGANALAPGTTPETAPAPASPSSTSPAPASPAPASQ